MSLQLSFAEASAIGPREENQDALRLVTPAPALAASKGYLFAIADGVSQCADGGLAARSTLQALALDYYATPETWGVAQALDRLLLAQNRWLQANGGGHGRDQAKHRQLSDGVVVVRQSRCSRLVRSARRQTSLENHLGLGRCDRCPGVRAE